MTVICAAICKDGIVLGADGLATDEKFNPLYTNFQKLRSLGNDIFFGFSGNKINPAKIDDIAAEFKALDSFRPPYTLTDLSKEFRVIVKRLFVDSSADQKFDISFLLCGYDRDKTNNAREPHVYLLSLRQDFEPQDELKVKEMTCIGTVPMQLPPDGMESLDTRTMREALVAEFIRVCVRMVHEKYPQQVGGIGKLVAIRPNSSAEETFDAAKPALHPIGA